MRVKRSAGGASSVAGLSSATLSRCVRTGARTRHLFKFAVRRAVVERFWRRLGPATLLEEHVGLAGAQDGRLPC